MKTNISHQPYKFKYQQVPRYFGTIADGIEDVAAAELAELGATDVKPAYRGVYFNADKPVFYRINYETRLLTRILAPLAMFDCTDKESLYHAGSRIHWERILTPDTTFAIGATVSNSTINHSHYAALCLKDAIADRFRREAGKRPDVDTEHPDILLNLHIEYNKATVSLDASDGSLHKRGYRKAMVDAPMNETTAAAVIRMSEWNGEQPLYDPFCGSGTLLCEALMHYCRMPAGMLRERFGVERLPDFDAALWRKVKHDAGAAIHDIAPGMISGSDILKQAVVSAKTNCGLLTFGNRISLKAIDFHDIPSLANTTIVCNPPYGIRLGNRDATGKLYWEFGRFLKERCPGAKVFMCIGDPLLVKAVGLKPAWKKPLKNGSIKILLVKFEVF
jgi:putative N6-adenine-specific DNA methylase